MPREAPPFRAGVVHSEYLAQQLTAQAHISQHIGQDEAEALIRYKRFLQQALAIQMVPAETVFQVKYAVARIDQNGRVGYFFDSSEQHFEISPQ